MSVERLITRAEVAELEQETERLREENEKLKDALRYYAEVYPEPRGEWVYTRRARAALLAGSPSKDVGEEE